MIRNEIVITGGLGFIGQNFVRYLDKKLNNYKIILYDKSKKNYKRVKLNSKKIKSLLL